MGKLEKGTVDMSRRCLILPHTMDALPNQHLLQYFLRLALATAVFSSHGCCFDLKEEKERNNYGILESRKAMREREQLQM
jgi:hypothetical protein